MTWTVEVLNAQVVEELDALPAAVESSFMTKARQLHRKWLDEPDYKETYAALAGEFDLTKALIDVRSEAGFTQQQLAQRMQTSQSVIARLESGRSKPSARTLERLAAATGTRLRIAFDPIPVS